MHSLKIIVTSLSYSRSPLFTVVIGRLSPMSLRPASWFIDDLVHLILESDDHWWPRDLLRLARVSSAWLEPARRRLYAYPTLHTFRACSLFARTLSENIPLLHLLKGINFRPMVEKHIKDSQPNYRDMAGLRYILGLDGLRSITLGGELAVGAKRFIHLMANSPTVNELRIDGSLLVDSLSSRPSLEWDETMAFKFPNLRTLHLVNLELDISYPSMSYELPITDLILDSVEIISGYLVHLLHETPTLHRLSLSAKTASEFDEQLRLVLDSCAIHTLHLEELGDVPFYQPIFDSDSPPRPSLNCLHLSGVRVDTETLALVGQKCQNLQELSITGRMIRVTPQEWAGLVGSGTFPSLRHLRVPWGA